MSDTIVSITIIGGYRIWNLGNTPENCTTHIDIAQYTWTLCNTPTNCATYTLQSIGGTCVVGFVHGSSSSEASRRGSGINKQMDLVFYLFLTGVREVTEPSDTSMAIGYTCRVYTLYGPLVS